MSRGDAHTTVHGQKLIVARHRAGWGQAHRCCDGFSREYVRMSITRFRAEGGWAHRPIQPHAHLPAADPRPS